MDKKLVVGGLAIVALLLLVLGFVVWKKSQVAPAPKVSPSESAIKKVDMATQPEWVQKLTVTTKRGVSANSLDNVTLTVSGIPKDTVSTLDYILQYETSNKGSQGAMSTKPFDMTDKTEFTKTFDFGTCSTKTCVRFEGVKSMDLELDFTTASSEKFTFVKTISLM